MIKMKIIEDKKSDKQCEECGRNWNNTKELYVIHIFGCNHSICKECSEELFKKLLVLDCRYMGKLKTKEDMQRKANAQRYTNAKTNI